jgi:starch phosphorylase
MTVLALSIAGRKNGVSELHGAVSRNIFKNAWPSVPEDEVPISHITNGIHTLTWMSPSIKALYDQHVDPHWSMKLNDQSIVDKIDEIPDEELWKTHCVLKTKMITFIREKLKTQRTSNGETLEKIREAENLLDTNALTFGFARRFATYKRADLIFRNMARIQNLINNPNTPIQLIFAGKAHPADRPAHEIIKHINDIASQEGFKGKVVLIENYNMTLARNLVQGVDVWLNNPRRPLEASGTSGQKVAINGIPNFSVLDGWWCEGYNGKNGWSIGDNTAYDNDYLQDNADSESIYQTLENEIVPLFYKRDSRGIPVEWVKMMKETMKSLTYKYSTHRMVIDYFSNMYGPCMDRMDQINNTQFSFAKDITSWKQKMDRIWPNLQIICEKNNNQLQDKKTQAGDKLRISTQVYLDSLSPQDVRVELYYGLLKNNQNIENAQRVEMTSTEQVSSGTFKYETDVNIVEGGEYGYTFRIIPNNSSLINVFDTGYVKWML